MHLAINKIWYIICQAVMSAARKSEVGGRAKSDGPGRGEPFYTQTSGGLPKVMVEQKPEGRSQKVTRGRGF